MSLVRFESVFYLNLKRIGEERRVKDLCGVIDVEIYLACMQKREMMMIIVVVEFLNFVHREGELQIYQAEGSGNQRGIDVA